MELNPELLFKKHYINTRRYLVSVIVLIFVILRYFSRYALVADFVVFFVTVVPFVLVLSFIFWVFYERRTNRLQFAWMLKNKLLLKMLFQASAALLVVLLLLFPDTWGPLLVVLSFIKGLARIGIDEFFLLLSYFGVATILFSLLISLFGRIRKKEAYGGNRQNLSMTRFSRPISSSSSPFSYYQSLPIRAPTFP